MPDTTVHEGQSPDEYGPWDRVSDGLRIAVDVAVAMFIVSGSRSGLDEGWWWPFPALLVLVLLCVNTTLAILRLFGYFRDGFGEG